MDTHPIVYVLGVYLCLLGIAILGAMEMVR